MEYTRFVGWDVHAATIAVAVAEVGRDPARFEGTLPATADAVRQWVRRQPDAATLLVCYEAGPTGFEMARLLTELGVTCQVVAPGLVPKKPTDRIKTDRRDAIKLAQALRAGSLTPVRIPTRSDEAFRDLIRTRTQAVEDQSRVRHRIKSALLRWGVRVPGTSRTWPGFVTGLPTRYPAAKRGRNCSGSWKRQMPACCDSPRPSRPRGSPIRWWT